jgi:2,4-dienoyl-CoA reductase-like NADH-dependent reductase (Old Yellow Enzyme family)
MSAININSEITLPCGAVIKNRIAKSAMSEAMAKRFVSDVAFQKLYQRWAEGGTGLVITGNVMVHRKALGEVGNIVFEKGINDPLLSKWAEAGKKNGTHIWPQINHPGRQSPKFLSPKPVGPSAVGLKAPMDKVFNQPRELTEDEIFDIIERFAYAAKLSKDNGFTGVQIHGAHGYLVSQFLSPDSNIRTDKWGGSIENRMRFVCEIYKAMRKAVGDSFPIGVKLNSADFQKGGFTKEDSMLVVKTLSDLGMDLIEISGGTYETPVMMDGNKKDSTKKREAYFLDYCEEVRKIVKTPLLLTGGFRSATGMNEALATGACDMIGLARSLAINPEFSKDLLAGKDVKSAVKPLSTGLKFLDKVIPLEIIWYSEQLHLMGAGKNPKIDRSALGSALSMMYKMGKNSMKKVR